MGNQTTQPSIAIVGLQTFILAACMGLLTQTPDAHPIAEWGRSIVLVGTGLTGLILRTRYRGEGSPLRRGLLDAMTAGVCVLLAQAALMGLIASGILGPDWVLPGHLRVLAVVAPPILCLVGATETRVRIAPLPHNRLIQDYGRFETRVRRRNYAEMMALTIIILLTAFYALRFHPMVEPLSWTFVTLYTAVLLYLVFRGEVRPLLPVGEDMMRVHYGAELRRQHRLRGALWWFWFIPLFAGLLTNAALGVLKGQIVFAVAHALGIVGLAYFIVRLNRDRERAVRQQVSSLAIPFA
ncbi:hypothetical protein [Nitrospirillum viridazoti]|uniref:Uncharacterized protein n=1 Tax=Nitrospirillum viridazoti CBAmc TaxID=1441467 RepID=A0A248K2D8_9PROT|nr:hypothetical protein [Nitrospirillum amazonense]ASG24916.1 hypothetical protein Y958_28420 [Nitrospirillum amazonense CBAmc]TWB30019.1 hypothetical protein FBZ91_12460 [Nitrospirillum amazonense]